jgi:hypothetical protein
MFFGFYTIDIQLFTITHFHFFVNAICLKKWILRYFQTMSIDFF